MTARGLFEAHLPVRDVARSVAFYRDVLGLQLAHEVPERAAAFMWAGGPGQTMLGLWGSGDGPMGLRLHIAFRSDLSDVIAAPALLRGRSIQARDYYGQPADEPSVIGWMPAAAVYFADPDEHSIELLAMLALPPRQGIYRWRDWQTGLDAAQVSMPAADRPPTASQHPPRLNPANPFDQVIRTYQLLFKRAGQAKDRDAPKGPTPPA